ncbi:Por secretion system C-terminal sorting domain-containing protein [Candidatus Kryptobacter tengchongensis]|nr:Por secretion system C-terminal sorting domain-containing protein [Candidatus Kryptobacter tengchongensis]
MRTHLLFAVLLLILITAMLEAQPPSLSNIWNPSTNAGQKWTNYRFRDAAIVKGGSYDGRVYLTSSANTIGIIYYEKSNTIDINTAPNTTPDGSFASTMPDGSAWGTAAPYGIAIDDSGYIYVASYGNKKIARYKVGQETTSGVILKDTTGTSDLILQQNPRFIRVEYAGENVKIYYGDGNSKTNGGVYVIFKSGNGWKDSLLFNVSLTTSRSIQAVIKRPGANTLYVTYNGSPYIEKFDYVNGSWIKDPNFVPHNFTLSLLMGISFIDSAGNFIIACDGTNRTFNILDAETGVRYAGINFGVSGEALDNAAVGIAYNDSIFFTVGSRSATAGVFEKIVSNYPLKNEYKNLNFRTVKSGYWSDKTIWEMNDGSRWVSANFYPSFFNSNITIRSGDTVIVDVNTVIDQLLIENGSILKIDSAKTLTISNGPATYDLDIKGILHNYKGTISVGSGLPTITVWRIANGGTYIHNTTTGLSTPLNYAIIDTNSTVEFRDSGTPTISGRTYWNLKFTSDLTLSLTNSTGSNPLTINGTFTIGKGVTWTLTSGFTGALNINGDFILDGVFNTRKNFDIKPNKTLYLNGILNLDSSITVTINGTISASDTAYVKGIGNFTLSDFAIFKTKHPNGLDGSLINTGEKNLSQLAKYIFNGTIPQVTGTILPVAIKHIEINNPSGVTLSHSIDVDTLLLISGDLTIPNPIYGVTVMLLFDASLNKVKGTGTFILSDNATFKTANLYGVDSTITTSTIFLSQWNTKWEFNGTSQQKTGNLIPDIIGKLIINNPGGLILSKDISSNSLEFVKGKLYLNDKDFYLFYPDITGHNKDRYVVADSTGELEFGISIPDSVFAPVGTKSTYLPVAVKDLNSPSLYKVAIRVDGKNPTIGRVGRARNPLLNTWYFKLGDETTQVYDSIKVWFYYPRSIRQTGFIQSLAFVAKWLDLSGEWVHYKQESKPSSDLDTSFVSVLFNEIRGDTVVRPYGIFWGSIPDIPISWEIIQAKRDLNNDFIPDLIDSTVTVVGIVISPNFVPVASGKPAISYYIQDETGGINIFRDGLSDTLKLNIGNLVKVKGRIYQYNGLTEIIPDSLNPFGNITILKPDTVPPSPVKISIAQFLSNPERYEGMLIKIDTVWKKSGTWPGAGSNANIIVYDKDTNLPIILRIDADTDIDGNPEPRYPINIIGIAGQFHTTRKDTGYQIIPRFLTDITRINLLPVVNLISPADRQTFGIVHDSAIITFTWSKPYDPNIPPDTIRHVIFKISSLPNFTTILYSDTLSPADTTISIYHYIFRAMFPLNIDTIDVFWAIFPFDGEGYGKSETYKIKLIKRPTPVVEQSNEIPSDYYLAQNYPNPFNSATTLEFGLPKESYVKLSIYNIIGQEIKILIDEVMNAGKYKINFDADKFSSGVYFYVLKTNDRILKRKMVLIK